jgi:hypothetical protein
MENETFEKALSEGLIHRNVTLKELKLLRNKKEKAKSPKAQAGPDVAAPSAQTEPTVPKPEAENAALKAAVNNPGLRLVDNNAAAASNKAAATATALSPATAAAPMGRIAIVVRQVIQDQHKADLDDLIEDIKAVVKEYDFIGGVELEVAA